jgi:LmeA-like phospholipid-binding
MFEWPWRSWREAESLLPGGMPDPAKMLEALRTGALNPPENFLSGLADPIDAVVTAARAGVLGREMTFRIGAAALTMTVVDLDAGTTPIGLMVGQYEDLRVVAEGVSWGDRQLRRLAVRCRNLHIRPGRTSTLVSAPVEIEAVLGQAEVASWLGDRLRHLSLTIGADSLARVALAAHPDLGHLEVTPTVHGSAIRLVPRALTVLGRQRALPRLPAPSVPLQGLPAGLSLRALELGPEQVSVHATISEWREPLAAARLRTLAGRLRAARGPIDLPPADAE